MAAVPSRGARADQELLDRATTTISGGIDGLVFADGDVYGWWWRAVLHPEHA